MTIVEEIQKLKQEKNAVILAHCILRRFFYGRERKDLKSGQNCSDAGSDC